MIWKRGQDFGELRSTRASIQQESGKRMREEAGAGMQTQTDRQTGQQVVPHSEHPVTGK